ncbi:BTB domain-containing protein [Fusarium falciforme]|uniref:BTB domain-containing protein n=1 Tax=Fusarium falciforme TaxID=195108 RepID=UPI0022FFD4CF|nr:BTB domain-containing protein [Fusarium falciforme]WAO84987.1 BTB domain-containing protein [Fusarium falciforme]
MTTPEDVKEWTTEALCANWSNTALRKFLYSGEFSDLTIRCGDREFKTHRAIVCPQSPFFKAAVGGNFEEGGSGIVDLPDDDPALVQYLIVFLYTGAYWVHISPDHWDILCDSQLKGDEGTGHEILERLERPPVPRSADTSVTIPAKRYHPGRLPCGYQRGVPAAAARKENQARENMKHSIQIYVLADKYDVPGLRLLARDRFLESGKECCITNNHEQLALEILGGYEILLGYCGRDLQEHALGRGPLASGIAPAYRHEGGGRRDEIEDAGRDGAPSSTGNEYRDEEDDGIDAFCATSIHASLSKLLHSEKFSDMTIRCGGREFKAHRAIVCTQSSFFDRALSSNFKEAASRVVELPDDDPDVLERFLEFMYKGTYSDNVNHTWGKPSIVAMMSPEGVQENLNDTPGVPEDFLAVGPTGADSDENDLDYKPPSSTSTGSNSNSEPEEEYNEYYGDSTSNSEQEPEHSPEKPSLGTMSVMKLSELVALDKEEAMQRLVKIRNDMALPLRLYIMADKYDVPALRLLARDRFYRAIELEWEHAESFPDIVDELYLGTPQTDTAMREIVCRIVGSRILSDRVREKMRPIMEKHGDFAVGVMEYAIHSSRIR